MTGRAAFPLLLLALSAPSCSVSHGPAETVGFAIYSARTGDLDRFLSCFTPESAPLLGMFWSVSTRYGYLDEDSLRYLADVEVMREETAGDQARVAVLTGGREGTLCLARSDGSWRIDLLAA
ncbi:MAG: hypothetical protein FJ109_17425, partial [Deltaproteobacteria bacterium]|nr:hypothetical protein [Deltaproteobacteria bacterium]